MKLTKASIEKKYDVSIHKFFDFYNDNNWIALSKNPKIKTQIQGRTLSELSRNLGEKLGACEFDLYNI